MLLQAGHTARGQRLPNTSYLFVARASTCCTTVALAAYKVVLFPLNNCIALRFSLTRKHAPRDEVQAEPQARVCFVVPEASGSTASFGYLEASMSVRMRPRVKSGN